MRLKSKLFAGAVALTMVLSMVAVPAAAQTTAELTAQINSLLAMIAQLQAQIAGGTTSASTNAATSMFEKDLTVGSTGSNVVDLQRWLVNNQYLTMPEGVAYGYFGGLTKAAVARFQSAKGITPAVGYFGPITRAKLNGLIVVVPGTPGTTVNCPTGWTCTPTGTTSGTITTPGAEGTISAVEASAGTVSTVYEGDSKAAILGIKVTATGSDMAVQRMKFQVSEDTNGSNTMFYNKIYKKLYVTEGGNVLASIDLNSSTVTKDGSSYYVSVTGFSSVVPKGASKTYLIKADAHSAIDSADYASPGTGDEVYTLAVAMDGIRAVDGAGIDDYAGTTAIAASPSISTDLTDSATLQLSLNSASPKKQDVVCSSNASEDECDKLTVLVFDAKAEKDAVTVTDLYVGVAQTSTVLSATASTTVYLYDGSEEIDAVSLSATAAGGSMYHFTDIDRTIAKDTTKTYTVKMDVRDATTDRSSFIVIASSTGITDENSKGDAVTDSGTATGYSIGVRKAGAEITLLSKSITTSGAPQVGGTSAPSTSTLTATFNVKVKAVGSDIYLGTVASTSYPFFEDAATSASGSTTPSFKIYKNGAVDATISSYATSTAFTLPSTCVTNGTNSCLLSEGTEISFPITLQLLGRTALAAMANGLYSIQYAGASWISSVGTVQTATFMDGEADWRTSDVSFP